MPEPESLAPKTTKLPGAVTPVAPGRPVALSPVARPRSQGQASQMETSGADRMRASMDALARVQNAGNPQGFRAYLARTAADAGQIAQAEGVAQREGMRWGPFDLSGLTALDPGALNAVPEWLRRVFAQAPTEAAAQNRLRVPVVSDFLGGAELPLPLNSPSLEARYAPQDANEIVVEATPSAGQRLRGMLAAAREGLEQTGQFLTEQGVASRVRHGGAPLQQSLMQDVVGLAESIWRNPAQRAEQQAQLRDRLRAEAERLGDPELARQADTAALHALLPWVLDYGTMAVAPEALLPGVTGRAGAAVRNAADPVADAVRAVRAGDVGIRRAPEPEVSVGPVRVPEPQQAPRPVTQLNSGIPTGGDDGRPLIDLDRILERLRGPSVSRGDGASGGGGPPRRAPSASGPWANVRSGEDFMLTPDMHAMGGESGRFARVFDSQQDAGAYAAANAADVAAFTTAPDGRFMVVIRRADDYEPDPAGTVTRTDRAGNVITESAVTEAPNMRRPKGTQLNSGIPTGGDDNGPGVINRLLDRLNAGNASDGGTLAAGIPTGTDDGPGLINQLVDFLRGRRPARVARPGEQAQADEYFTPRGFDGQRLIYDEPPGPARRMGAEQAHVDHPHRYETLGHDSLSDDLTGSINRENAPDVAGYDRALARQQGQGAGPAPSGNTGWADAFEAEYGRAPESSDELQEFFMRMQAARRIRDTGQEGNVRAPLRTRADTPEPHRQQQAIERAFARQDQPSLTDRAGNFIRSLFQDEGGGGTTLNAGIGPSRPRGRARGDLVQRALEYGRNNPDARQADAIRAVLRDGESLTPSVRASVAKFWANRAESGVSAPLEGVRVSPAEAARIQRLAAEGKNDTQIAREVGMSVQAVTRARDALGVERVLGRPGRVTSEETLSTVRGIADGGGTIAEAAQATGLVPNSIRNMANRHGITFRDARRAAGTETEPTSALSLNNPERTRYEARDYIMAYNDGDDAIQMAADMDLASPSSGATRVSQLRRRVREAQGEGPEALRALADQLRLTPEELERFVQLRPAGRTGSAAQRIERMVSIIEAGDRAGEPVNYAQVAERLRSGGYPNTNNRSIQATLSNIRRGTEDVVRHLPQDLIERVKRLPLRGGRPGNQSNAGIDASQILPWLATGGYFTGLNLITEQGKRATQPQPMAN